MDGSHLILWNVYDDYSAHRAAGRVRTARPRHNYPLGDADAS